jgi:hypothetical protein
MLVAARFCAVRLVSVVDPRVDEPIVKKLAVARVPAMVEEPAESAVKEAS